MSDLERSRELWRKILAIRGVCNVLDILNFAHRRGSKAYKKAYDKFITKSERYLQFLDVERTEVRDLLSKLNTEELSFGLKHKLQELTKPYEEALAKIPRSLDKAKGSLLALIDIGDFETAQECDVLCLLREHVSPNIITQIVTKWKEELRFFLAEREKPIKILELNGSKDVSAIIEEQSIPNFLPKSYIFWTSESPHMETTDAISYYRLMEVFNIEDFSETMDEIENMFAYALVGLYPFYPIGWEDIGWGWVAYNLWLASRSPRLCRKTRHFIEIALARVLAYQHIEGWWPYISSRHRQALGLRGQYLPSNCLTALSCVDLLRLSRNNGQLKHAERGVRWLVKQQLPDGAWTDIQIYDQQRPQKPDLFTTLLAVDAIKESGLTGYGYTVSKAESWIMNHQGPDGTWGDEGFPFPFMTILVVEYFERRRPPLSKLENYLSIARDFILRSQELALEDSENSRRLAIVVAFQGIEAFLYACLSHPSVNIRIFEERRPNRTIGMRRALDELEKHLQREGILEQEQSIEHRNQLDRLAYHRDEIVHKGAFIAEKDALELTEASASFCELICQRIFGHSLL